MESKRNTRNKLSTDFLLFPNKIRRLSIRELHSKLPLKKAVYHSWRYWRSLSVFRRPSLWLTTVSRQRNVFVGRTEGCGADIKTRMIGHKKIKLAHYKQAFWIRLALETLWARKPKEKTRIIGASEISPPGHSSTLNGMTVIYLLFFR